MGRIEDLIETTSESETLEFKSAKGGFPRSFWESYSSFANTQGGVIYLGVKEKDHQFYIDGLTKEVVASYVKDLWDTLNNPNKASINLLADKDVQIIETENGCILEVTVPRAELGQRPVFLNGTPYGNTFKRNAEGDYVCTAEEVKRMFAEANLNEVPLDCRILHDFSFADDIDRPSFEEYRRLFSSLHPTHPWAGLEDIDFLTRLGGYRIDRHTKEEGLTVAGLLMFGRYASITDPECCPQFFPDYREYKSSEDSDRWSDRICNDGTWETNLFQFYRRAFNKLSESLPKPFALRSGVRVEDSPIHVAIREAFVNCIIHCDYTVNANIIVESHRNKYVFSNPGSLLIPMSQYYKGGESICRNPSLQKMFMQIGSAEKAGSGVDKILKGWKSANYQYPNIEESANKFILTLPLESILSENVLQKLKSMFGDNIIYIDHDSLLVLAACATEGYTSNYRMQLVLEKHPSDITLILKELCQKLYLIPSGIGKGTVYHLNESYSASRRKQLDINESNSSTSSTTFSSGYPGFSTNVASSQSNVVSSGGNMVSSGPNVVSSNDAKKKRTRVRMEQLEIAILDFCRDDYRSVEEIARGVGKTIKYLNNGIVSKLVGENRLIRKYPNIPTHPDQKYKSVSDGKEPTLFDKI